MRGSTTRHLKRRRSAGVTMVAALMGMLLISSSGTARAASLDPGSPAHGEAVSLAGAAPALSAHDNSLYVESTPAVLRGVKMTPGCCSEADFQQLQAWGMRLIRLHLQWVELEPNPPVWLSDGTWQHTYDTKYLSQIRAYMAMAAKYGMYVILNNRGCTPDDDDINSCPFFSSPAWLYQAPDRK